MKKNTFLAKQNHVTKGLLLLITVWLIWFIGSALVGQVRDVFVQSQELHYVTMEHNETGYGMFAITEHMIVAEANGKPEVMIGEGERVRKGNAVFRIGDLYQYTNYAGRVSYRIDGLEAMNDIAAISQLNWKQKYNEQEKRNSKNIADAVEGEPCAKVQETMDNIALYLSVPINDYTNRLTIGQQTKVTLSDYGTTVKGTIVEILNTDDTRCVKLEIGRMTDDAAQKRIHRVALPYDSERVLVIPKQALIQKKGVDGVYCLHKGFVFWKAVTVSERWLEQGLLTVEDGLKEGDVVVTTPHFVREGENIKF